MGKEDIYIGHFLFTIVMATIPTTSKLSAATSSESDNENRTDYETDLSAKNTDNEIMLILVPGPLLIRKGYSI